MEWRGTTYDAWYSDGEDQVVDGWYYQFYTGIEIVGSIGPFKTEQEAMQHLDSTIDEGVQA